MSFGTFEAAVGSDIEVGLAKQASVDKMAGAVYDVREKLGPVLFASRDLEEFRHKIAMMKEDQSLFKVIEASGLFPLPRVMRQVVGTLQEEFKEALRKGAPFAGYEDFDDCTSKNSDKGDSDAYCGEIKHRTEDKKESRRRRADFDGTQEIDNTFEDHQGEALKPKGDFKGYLKKMDQGAPEKVKRNFASKQAVTTYRHWCEANNLSPVRLSSLDRYAENLSTEDYFRLANVILAWENEHHPKVPSTSLKAQDKVARREISKHRYASRYLAWCHQHHLAPADPTNLRNYGKYTARVNPEGFRYVANILRRVVVSARSHYAAPDYLQKADDALTQLLNQKAEEFQQTIAPLQQALVTVQQAEQLQQQQNPLNVLPTPGTVNVMPGQSDSTPGQLGMPDPNQPDISGLVQALQPGGGDMGGVAPQGDTPGGGNPDAGAPPPAAAGGGLPPDLEQSAGRAARRGKGKGVARPRQAAGVGEQWDSWRKRKEQSGDALRGGEVDYEQFRNETGVGDRALNKLKQRNQTPDFEPINGGQAARPKRQPEGVTVGSRHKACWPGCHENEAHAAKFHSKDKDDKKEGQRKQAWSGWGPAVFPKVRKVAGWDWDDHLNGYLANKPQHFACTCGDAFPTPSGFQRCACGRQWNSYIIGTGGNAREASADKFIVREVPVRPDVIVANRKLGNYEDMPDDSPQSIVGKPADSDWHLDRGNSNAAWALHKEKQHGKPLSQFTKDDWAIAGDPPARKARRKDYIQLVDKQGNIHNLIDPGEVGEGEDPGHSTFKKQPKDWARRSGDGKWTPNAIG